MQETTTTIREVAEAAAIPEGGWSYARLARHWDCSVKTIRRRVEAGELEVFYVGALPRVTDESRRRAECARTLPACA